jgi:hypothetical protein
MSNETEIPTAPKIPAPGTPEEAALKTYGVHDAMAAQVAWEQIKDAMTPARRLETPESRLARSFFSQRP